MNFFQFTFGDLGPESTPVQIHLLTATAFFGGVYTFFNPGDVYIVILILQYVCQGLDKQITDHRHHGAKIDQ